VAGRDGRHELLVDYGGRGEARGRGAGDAGEREVEPAGADALDQRVGALLGEV
jgi:hypothetical protein